MNIFSVSDLNKYLIDQTDLDAIEQEAKNNKYETLVSYLVGFTDPAVNHDFLASEKGVAVRWLDLMCEGWEKGKIQKELVEKVNLQFVKFKVCKDKNLVENFTIYSGESTFSFNKSMLLLRSEYFKTMVHSNMVEANTDECHLSNNYLTVTEKGEISIVTEPYSKETINVFKRYLYFGTKPKIEDIIEWFDLFYLSRITELQTLSALAMGIITDYIAHGDINEKNINRIFGFLNELEKNEESKSLTKILEISLLKHILTKQKIKFSIHKQKLKLDISYLYLLKQEGPVADLIKKYTTKLKIDSSANYNYLNFINKIPLEQRCKIETVEYSGNIVTLLDLESKLNLLPNLQKVKFISNDFGYRKIEGKEKFFQKIQIISDFKSKEMIEFKINDDALPAIENINSIRIKNSTAYKISYNVTPDKRDFNELEKRLTSKILFNTGIGAVWDSRNWSYTIVQKIFPKLSFNKAI